MTTAAGRLTAMIRAEAGTGSAGLRPRPRSRFRPPPPGAAPDLAGWDDLASGGPPSSLLEAGEKSGPLNGAQVAPDPSMWPAEARRPIRWSPQRPDGAGPAAGAADDALARQGTPGPGTDDEGDAEQQLASPRPGSVTARRGAGTGSQTVPGEQLPAAPGPLEPARRTTHGARADDLTHNEHAAAISALSVLSGRHEHVAGHRLAADHTSHEPPPGRAARTGLHPGNSDQALELDAHDPGRDSGQSEAREDRTAPVGALRPRPARPASSIARRRPVGGDAGGGGDARGEPEVTVQVSIGRIEVRVAPEAPGSRQNRGGTPPAIRPGLVTLEEYSARRGAQR